MTEASTKGDEISKALSLLDAAAQKEKEHIQNLLKGGYAHFKEALHDSQDSIAGTLSNTNDEFHRKAKQVKDFSVERAKVVDHHVHESPWQYLAGATVFGLVMGFVLGRQSARP